MGSMVVRCQAKTYDRFRQVTLIDKEEDMFSAFIQSMTKEVNQLSYKKKKRFIRLLQTAHLTIVPMLVAPKAHAESILDQTKNFPMLEKASGLSIIPDEIVDLLVQLVVACGIVGTLLAMMFLMVAGGLKMFGQSEKAQVWSQNIIRGLGQILLAPVIILLLVTITVLIFRNVPGLELFY